MSEKEIAKIENSLFQARKEGLLKANDSSMKSHGKLWGMDVFSWVNPNLSVLTAAMNSFPFPIFWISSLPERDGVLSLSVELTTKIQFSILLDSDKSIATDLQNSTNSMVVSSFHEAFIHMNGIKMIPSILLFTYSKSDWNYQMKCFNDCLLMAQVK